MGRLPVTIATLIAMIHMAIGCAWHHGIRGEGGCSRTCHAVVDASLCQACDADQESDVHRKGHSLVDTLTPCPVDSPCGLALSNPTGAEHSPCVDDRCTFTRPGSVDIGKDADWVVQLQPGFLTRTDTPTQALDGRVRDCRMAGIFPPNLRAHLFLGVLTL